MDEEQEEFARLLREERVLDAAKAARAAGRLDLASQLFERACEFREAAVAALEGGNAARALTLAAEGGASEVADAALDILRQSAAVGDLTKVADGLRHRRLPRWAAAVYEAAGAMESAADAWQLAGEQVRAAELLEAAPGRGAAFAARALEAGLRREPDRADLLLALGSLLLRTGRSAPALRALQRVPDDAPEKREALSLSLQALTELGMTDARAEVMTQLAALGGAVRPAPLAPAAPVEAGERARLYGRYDVVREVTSTPTARVLEAWDVIRNERVAVKLFSAQGGLTRGAGRDALARFAREARVLAQLAHPNVVPLLDVLEQGPALVLAWMSGGTLEERLSSESFAPARAVGVACAVLEALGQAHRLGVIHRDIKPANIMFDAAGTARLSDFGVAHLGDLSVTATAGSFGSLAYMSPEQREGRPATAQSDIYGVGVVLIEMLTGVRAAPDNASRWPSVAATHRHLDARHDAAVLTLVSRDPAGRPVDAFTAARLLSELPWPSDVDDGPTAARRAAQRRPVSARPEPLRLATPGAAVDAPAQDRWLERPVVRVPLTAQSLAIAGVYARVGHRALQAILRVDRDGGLVWLAAPRGARLDRMLLERERATLGEALALLHAEGLVHGSIGRETVRVSEAGPLLLFPLEAAAAVSPSVDVAALFRL